MFNKALWFSTASGTDILAVFTEGITVRLLRDELRTKFPIKPSKIKKKSNNYCQPFQIYFFILVHFCESFIKIRLSEKQKSMLKNSHLWWKYLNLQVSEKNVILFLKNILVYKIQVFIKSLKIV